jgi:dTDP-4-dehydrorhamnose reductase
MLGHKVWQILRPRFDTWVTLRTSLNEYSTFDLFDPDRTVPSVDATREDCLIHACTGVRPDVIVNCIGIVKQRRSAKDPVLCLTLNSLLPHRLASICRETGSRLIHISTDCVFSGRKGGYVETDPADAEDLYGRTKLLGEPHEADHTALTLRTSIIGRELRSTTGLVEWFLSQRGGTVDGFTNAVFTGLTTRALAQVIGDLIEQHPKLAGLYHVSSAAASKYELLAWLNEAFAAGIMIQPSDAVSVDRSLESGRFWRATGLHQPSWRAMIADMVADPTPYDQWRRTYVS